MFCGLGCSEPHGGHEFREGLRSGRGLGCDGGTDSLNPSGGALPADVIMATGLARLHEAAARLSCRACSEIFDARNALVHGRTRGVLVRRHQRGTAVIGDAQAQRRYDSGVTPNPSLTRTAPTRTSYTVPRRRSSSSPEPHTQHTWLLRKILPPSTSFSNNAVDALIKRL